MGNENQGYGPDKDDVELDPTAAAASGLALEAGGNLADIASYIASAMDQSFIENAGKGLALSTSAAITAQLSNGWYLISADSTARFLQADSDADTDLDAAITAGSPYDGTHLLPLGGARLIKVTGATNDYLAMVVLSGSGHATVSGPF